MRLIGKLLALPFVLVTGILYLVCKFLVVISGAVLVILSGIVFLAALALFFAAGFWPGLSWLVIAAYCSERKNGIDAAAFIDYYAARGWKLNGGQPMKDWRAAVRTWERRNKAEQKGGAEDDYWSRQ